MDKIEIKKISEKKYFITIINGNEEFMFSNGTSLKKDELYKFYIKLRDIFSNEDKK